MEEDLFNYLSEDNKNKEEKYNNFPQGTKYEEELNTNFKYFNIFWYDPNKSNDFDDFKKCFENVQFYKAYDLESILKFFEKESSFEWIIITPGSKGEELVKNLEENQCIKAFFIYCWDVELHEKWVKNKKKVKCLTSDPEILCQKFIELNKEYLIPNFKYRNKESEQFFFNFKKLKSKNKYALNSVKREIKNLIQLNNETKNKYKIFCIKSLHYLNSVECINDFKEPVADENSPLYYYVKLFKNSDIKIIKKVIKWIKNLTLLSLYFSQYKYLFNLLSINELKALLKDKITINSYQNREEKIASIVEKLCEKLNKNESILDEKNDLKEIQIHLIILSLYNIISSNNNNNNLNKLINYYQILNYFRDVDFCFKIIIYETYFKLNNKNHNFVDDMYSSLISSDIRFSMYLSYLDNLNKIDNELNKEYQREINDSLNIKDFLIIGNKEFQKKIKLIEKDLKAKSIKYLQIEQISNYINEKNEKDNNRERQRLIIYFYYLIITFEEFQENYEKIILLSAEFGITFIVLLYIENEDNNIIFHKNGNSILISIILVYSPEDIIKYLSQNINFEIPKYNFEYLNDVLNIKIPKISFDVNNEKDFQDGCFELAETFDTKLIKNKVIISYFDNIEYITEISKNIYEIYKEHNALDLFYKQNGIYFGFLLKMESITLDICYIKRILYMYCREEIESKKSFYRMINDDLRTRNPSKIYRYIDLLGLIYKLIENEELANYKGKVYRATKLDENLIFKLKPETIMVNTTFWSTSKDFNIAERFMENDKWRNSYIFCEAVKNNIDIDFENLNSFAEKEVLFLPFTEFKVKKVSCEKKYQKKIFIIELCELGNKNFVNYDNMHIENLNTYNVMAYIEKELSKKNEK